MSTGVEFQELGDLGGLSGEVSGEIRVPMDDNDLEDEGSTLDEPVMTTLVSNNNKKKNDMRLIRAHLLH